MRRAWILLVVSLAAIPAAPGQSAQPGSWGVAVFPSGDEFRLELAKTTEQQARGYMFREHIGPREGMLFLFDAPGRHAMWMKNCRVALDLIWLDEHYRVLSVAHEQPPCPEQGECPSVSPMQVSRYVLELAGGVAREQNLQPGDRIVILEEPSTP